MNDNLKKGLLIGTIIVAVAFAIFQVFKSGSTERTFVEAESKVPPGHKSEKERALEQQTAEASKEGSEDEKSSALAGG